MSTEAGGDKNEARWELSPAELSPDLGLEELGFQTTLDLEPLEGLFGQERAAQALAVGLDIRHRSYNVFVSGLSGPDRKDLISGLLADRAGKEAAPDDWVYVHNFDEPDCPLALRLPSGHGVRLRSMMTEIVSRLRHDLPEAFKAEDFSAQRERLGADFGKKNEAIYNELLERAKELNMMVQRLPNGVLGFIPLKDGKPIEAKDSDSISEEERADIERRQNELGEEAHRLMAKQQELSRELRAEVEEIARDCVRRILDPLCAEARAAFPGERIGAWLDRVKEHMVANPERFGPQEERPSNPAEMAGLSERGDPTLEYKVNVVADNSASPGAPVVVEISPTYKNLFGTIERDVNLFGRVTTDFTRIKPGSLLRANGGYLVLDLGDALTEPLVWKQLKRTLQTGLLLTESYDPFALFTAAALKPQPIPIDTKVVAIGTTSLYYLLRAYDEDFGEIFKIRADFGPEAPRDSSSHAAYARLVARQVKTEKLLPFSAGAVVQIIRFGIREAGHREKLSVELGAIGDLVRESHHFARQAGAQSVAAEHVSQALNQRVERSGRIPAKVREMIAEGALRLSLEGRSVGQVNGLSVVDLGEVRFGWPWRITAATGIGQEGIVNIERESELAGSTYNKGVLILEGYLRNRYARQHPLSLSASLAFEQSYGWIDGDSASSAELYCLLSSLAGVPIRQDIAVTGSVNQHGEVQVIGGVNEKVEGFFDVCLIKGLTGTQGVCIPRGNVPNLILRPDVIDAVAKGLFHIWAVGSIDEGLELLTGVPAGNAFEEGTIHFLADQRLREHLARLQEQSPAAAAPRSRIIQPGAPPPSPPQLPGEDQQV
ncbi:MAG: Lon protease family protein [Isosphaeraceae bacterium]